MKYLGIDFGLKRIGLAISDGEIASPLKVVEVKGLKDAIQKIYEFAHKGKFTKIIVGLPEGKIGQTVKGFVKGLGKMGLEVETSEETLSSKQAISQMIELNIPKKKRAEEDAYSAAIILQKYLDNL